MMRKALESGDLGAYQALESQTSKRGRLLKELRRAVEEEKYYKAAELSKELRVETNRRQDVTQDEGVMIDTWTRTIGTPRACRGIVRGSWRGKERRRWRGRRGWRRRGERRRRGG